MCDGFLELAVLSKIQWTSFTGASQSEEKSKWICASGTEVCRRSRPCLKTENRKVFGSGSVPDCAETSVLAPNPQIHEHTELGKSFLVELAVCTGWTLFITVSSTRGKWFNLRGSKPENQHRCCYDTEYFHTIYWDRVCLFEHSYSCQFLLLSIYCVVFLCPCSVLICSYI